MKCIKRVPFINSNGNIMFQLNWVGWLMQMCDLWLRNVSSLLSLLLLLSSSLFATLIFHPWPIQWFSLWVERVTFNCHSPYTHRWQECVREERCCLMVSFPVHLVKEKDEKWKNSVTNFFHSSGEREIKWKTQPGWESVSVIGGWQWWKEQSATAAFASSSSSSSASASAWTLTSTRRC